MPGICAGIPRILRGKWGEEIIVWPSHKGMIFHFLSPCLSSEGTHPITKISLKQYTDGVFVIFSCIMLHHKLFPNPVAHSHVYHPCLWFGWVSADLGWVQFSSSTSHGYSLVCQTVFSRETEQIAVTYYLLIHLPERGRNKEREIEMRERERDGRELYFKELSHTVVETSKSKSIVLVINT